MNRVTTSPFAFTARAAIGAFALLACGISPPMGAPLGVAQAAKSAATPAAAKAPAPIPEGKLPRDILPQAYRLELTILPDQDSFSGHTEIDVRVAKSAAVYYLHGNGLKVASATYVPAPAGGKDGQPVTARYEQVGPTGVARLTFPAALKAGNGTLRFDYTAPFDTNDEGLYQVKVDGEAYAFTQFESIDARRMFPGFDEPAFKTPFDVAVTSRAGNVIIGNAPEVSTAPAGEGLRRVVFATTKPLPTYLLALAVGPLDLVVGEPLPPNAVRKHPLPLRAVATKGKGSQLRYALENTNAIVTYLETYFGREFPYPKLDLIASPAFGTGAMENAGAIVYGDARILLTPDAPIEQRRGFGVVHAHELAHQWFGDLVTPKWWDDTWLNESFANWMSYKAAGSWRPEYQFAVIPEIEALAAMDLDSRLAARQIRQPVATNLEIASSFDGITYLKGGSVLAMFESYLGENGFRDGIRTHMQRFAYGVADVDDFMESLARGSGRPDVVPAFRSFIQQPGVPIVDVAVDCAAGGTQLRLAQSRYLPLGSKGDRGRTWQVPLCVRSGGDGALAKQCALLKDAAASVPLAGAGCPTLLMPNADGAGYYRFGLDAGGWRNLVAGFDRLGQREGLAAADSLSAAWQANKLSTAELMAAIPRMAASPYTQVAIAPTRDLIRMRDDLAPPALRPKLTAFMEQTWAPRLATLGISAANLDAGRIDPSTTDAAAIDRALARTNLVRFVALEARDADLRAALADRARKYVRADVKSADGKDPGLDATAIDPALAGIALQVGVQELGLPYAEVLIDRLGTSSDARFRADAAVALGSTDDPAVGDRARALLLDPRLRGREPTSLAFALSARPSQRRATFEWFKANQDAFIERLSHFAHRWLPRFGAGFCTLPERDEVAAVFTPLLPRLQGADRTLNETLEGIELCAALAQAKGTEVADYFSALPAPTSGMKGKP